MSRKKARILVIGGGLVLAVVLVVVSAVLRSGNLDQADKWAGVIGVYLNIAALVVAVLGLVLGVRVGRDRGANRVVRQVIEARGRAVVKAPRSQQATGPAAADADQRISGRGKGTVDASDAQILRGTEGANDTDG
ncbi:hypothetical protein [Amycolatopsis sp. NPDC004625]|uniref:hypothetical protein n=1 Tax=Amycolatopsis sp. NPDC004625 TaxID=3154670 RepID=UPI0033A21ECA